MAKAVTEVAIGAAAIGAAIAIPGGGIAIGGLLISHAAAVSALVSIGASQVMSGLADALKSHQGGIAVGVTTPIGPWAYVYGTQKIGGVEIFRESNNSQGTSNNKELHRVYALTCHPSALGAWQLRIDGKQVLVQAYGSGFASYSPTQIQYNITSISRTNGVVTLHLSGSMPAGTDGSTLQVRSVSNNTFNGTWTVTQPNPADFTTFTFICGGADTTTSGGNARTTYSNYKDKIYIEFLNGHHSSTFQGLLASGTSWSATDLCIGHTLVYVRMGYDDSVFPSSIPNVSFVIQGKNDILDPRDGIRRWTNNAALCIADFLSLPTTIGGFGLQIGTDIPTAALIAAANICDEAVLLNAGGTVPRYTCNTFFQLNMTRGSILKTLLSSCAGRITYQGGQYSIVPAAWVAPTLQLNDGDLRGGIHWNPSFSVRDTCNAVKGTYVSPENAYQQADVPPYMQDAKHGFVSDPWLEQDNGERIFKEANFPCTDNSATAQRLAKIALLRMRHQGRGTIRCSLKAYQAVALDVIQLTHAHYTWLNKNFEVLSSRFGFDKSGDAPLPYVELDIAETDPSIYDWSPGEQLTPQGYRQPNNVGVRICTPPEDVTAYSGPGATINGVVYPQTSTFGADGRVQNSIYVTWTPPNDANVVLGGHLEVRCETPFRSYAVGGEPTYTLPPAGWFSLGKINPDTNYAYITGVNDGAPYNVQVRAVNCAGVPSDWVAATPTPVVVSMVISRISAAAISYKMPITTQRRLPPVDPNDPTLLEMMPWEQNAEVTVGKSLSVLTDRTMAFVSDAVGRYAAAEVLANNTAGHVLTSQLSPSSYVTTTSDTLVPAAGGYGWGWNVTSLGLTDVYNLSVSLNCTQTSAAFIGGITLSVAIDGNIGSPIASWVLNFIATTSNITTMFPAFTSISGLSAGAHTVQIYAHRPSTGAWTINSASVAILQRIF